MSDNQKFADLKQPRRIWAVGAVHGEVDRLISLHDDIGRRFQPGDRLVYLGNYLGRGRAIPETMAELLSFRRALLAMPGMLVDDIVYLRGCQEEMWQKLLQIQFAPNPREVLEWMLNQGLDATLASYGSDGDQAMAAARDGVMALARWTNGLRAAVRGAPGHDNLLSALRRAAYTRPSNGVIDPGAGDDAPAVVPDPAPSAVLLVSSGIDVTRPFGAQGDTFWWGGASFHRITQPYGSFRRVVRGYDPNHGGVQITDVTATLDGGCGFGGRLVAGCLTSAGDVLELIEA